MGRKILSIVVTLGIILVGAAAYSSGGTMELRFLDIEISPGLFYAIMGAILIFEVVDLISARSKPGEAGSSIVQASQTEQLTPTDPTNPTQGPTP